jgi:3-hydroxyisobutyrate dehydrogenase
MTRTDHYPAARLDEPIGFIGLGVMGQPMALRLAGAGAKLVVWNRSPAGAEALRAAGASVAASVEEVFDRTRIVKLMLFDADAIDAVLQRRSPDFARLVADHVIVSMGSNAPEFSCALAADIAAAGGRYVEAPMSGSRKPAETGQLVCMMGGDPDTAAEVRPLFAPMCRETIYCGPVGTGLLMKLAVNHYLCTTLASLAEAFHFAERNGLDLPTFKATIDAGPLACEVTRVKLGKLVAGDFSVHASTSDGYNSTSLIADAARVAGIASPILDVSRSLFGESVVAGHGQIDLISVIKAIEARTDAIGNDRG